MQRTFLITAVLFIQSVLFGQGWERVYGPVSTPGLDRSCGVRQTVDGGYISVGSCYYPTSPNEQLQLIKTDALGDTTWTRVYGYSYTDRGNAIEQTSDGGYIITGISQSPALPSYEPQILLMKTDVNGDSVWAKWFTFPGSYQAEGLSVKQTPDGGYVVAGYRLLSFGSGTSDAVLIKTNSTGDLTWSQIYGLPTLSECAQSVALTSDGGYIVGGWTITPPSTFGRDGYFIKTDPTGNPVWTKIYGDNGGNDEYAVFEIIEASDGSFVGAGHFYDYPSSDASAWLIKMDIAGDTAWTKNLRITPNFTIGTSLQQTSDGGYIIAGRTGIGSVGTIDLALIKTDAAGDTAWTRRYGSSGDDEWGHSVRQTTDGGYIISGESGQSVYLVKTDGSGNSTELVTDISLSPSAISPDPIANVFPNPFISGTTIDLNYNCENGTLKITDILGKEIRTIDFIGKQVSLQREGLGAGIYFIQLSTGNKIVSTRKIIII
jgi:hypothetical protein